MTLTVIEGSWDEIQQRAAELQGRRLRVIVLPESENHPTGTLYEFLGDFVGCIEGRAEPLAEQSEQAVENLIAEAHRSQGLDV